MHEKKFSMNNKLIKLSNPGKTFCAHPHVLLVLWIIQCLPDYSACVWSIHVCEMARSSCMYGVNQVRE